MIDMNCFVFFFLFFILLNVLNNVFNLFCAGSGGYQEAMKYYQMALPILKARGLNYRCLLLYTSIGFNYYMQGKYKKAIQ